MLHFSWLNCSFVLGSFPPSTLWISSMAFPLFEVSGSSELRKVTQSTEVHRTRLFDFLPSQGSWGGWISKQKEKKNAKLSPNTKQAFFFLSFFFFEVQYCFLYFFFFLIFCVFTFALPVSNRGWKCLKLFRKHALLIFLTGTGAESMTYELLPLWCTITEAESAKHECIRLALALKGLPRSRSVDGDFKRWITKQTPSVCINTNNY